MSQQYLDDKTDVISDELLEKFHTANLAIVAALIAAFGIMTNLTNIVIFLKQGLEDSINISFFGLSVSDMCSLITLEWVNLLRNPLFFYRVPFLPDEVQYLSAAWPHASFARTTSWITVYITLERCLCVLVPLKIKRIVRPRFTISAVLCIFIVMFLTIVPDYATCYFGWKFDAKRNRSLIGLLYMEGREQMIAVSFNFAACTQIISFGTVIILTAILVIKMKHQSKWRTTAGQGGLNSSTERRDNRTVKMIILIAIIYCICNLPMVFNFSVTCIEPKFIIQGRYHNSFMLAWSIGFIMNSINSSVNIFVYYFMSTKYRTTFDQLILKKNIKFTSDDL